MRPAASTTGGIRNGGIHNWRWQHPQRAQKCWHPQHAPISCSISDTLLRFYSLQFGGPAGIGSSSKCESWYAYSWDRSPNSHILGVPDACKSSAKTRSFGAGFYTTTFHGAIIYGTFFHGTVFSGTVFCGAGFYSTVFCGTCFLLSRGLRLRCLLLRYYLSRYHDGGWLMEKVRTCLIFAKRSIKLFHDSIFLKFLRYRQDIPIS